MVVPLDPSPFFPAPRRPPERAGIKRDPFTGTDHTVYSLRHTAICMRIILSHGQVNIFNLAKNAGTSVKIEFFGLPR